MTWDELRKLIEGKGSEVSMICKNCKHWERSPGVLWAVSDTEELRRDDVGQCWKASQKNPLVYAYGPDDDGQLYTGETFSCAAFEHGAQEARAIEIRPKSEPAEWRAALDSIVDYVIKHGPEIFPDRKK